MVKVCILRNGFRTRHTRTERLSWYPSLQADGKINPVIPPSTVPTSSYAYLRVCTQSPLQAVAQNSRKAAFYSKYKSTHCRITETPFRHCPCSNNPPSSASCCSDCMPGSCDVSGTMDLAAIRQGVYVTAGFVSVFYACIIGQTLAKHKTSASYRARGERVGLRVVSL